LADLITSVHAIRLPLSSIVDATSAIVREIIAMILTVIDFVVAAIGNRVLPIASLVRSIA